MVNINENIYDGIIIISDKFNISATQSSPGATPYLNNIDDEYTISFTDLQSVSKFTKFTYDTLSLTETRYLVQYYRISRDGLSWSTWIDLKKDI